MKKSRRLYAVCYFICLTLGLMPLLTPAVIVTTGPGYYRYYQYWIEHLLPIFGVFYMTFVHGFRPKFNGIALSTGFMMALAAMALICNFNIEGANYLYLARGTTDGGGSIMDVLIKIAPNVWERLAFLTVVVLAMFFLAYGVYRGICKLASKKSEHKAKIPV